MQESLAEVRGALAEAHQARKLSNPVLDISVRFPTGGGTEVIEASLSQSLLELLTLQGRSRAADARLRAASSQVVTAALDVLADLERTYAEAQLADAQLKVLDSQALVLDRLVEVAQSRLRAGEAGRVDLIGFQARRAALAADIEQTRAQRRAARLTLARLVGSPSSAAEWELEEWTAQPLASTSEQEWVALALERRPEVQAAMFELAALGEEVRLAAYEPFQELGAGVELEHEEETSIGPAASIPIPLFDLGRHRKAAAEAQRAAARHRLTAARRLIVEEVRQALAAAESSQRSLALIESELLPLQRENLERIQASYRAGLADVTDVLQAEQDLLDAEALLIGARRDAAVAATDLRRASGGAAVAEAATTSPSNEAKQP